MSSSRINALQWFGLMAAPLAWATQLVAGYYSAEAHCEATQWQSGWSPTLLGMTGGAALVAVAGEIAATAVFLRLRRVSNDSAGPPGRQHLFAVGAMVGNVLFFVAILLGGVTAVALNGCRPA
ncbi:MAG TPA: hypothetical protein VG265_14005 [Gaiellaceae bacterium]|nr:hypothetical protein [Gaiellaceae bacterium]